jgi:hypothetical protein
MQLPKVQNVPTMPYKNPRNQIYTSKAAQITKATEDNLCSSQNNKRGCAKGKCASHYLFNIKWWENREK